MAMALPATRASSLHVIGTLVLRIYVKFAQDAWLFFRF